MCLFFWSLWVKVLFWIYIQFFIWSTSSCTLKFIFFNDPKFSKMIFYSCIWIGLFVLFNGTYAFNSLENLSSNMVNERGVVQNSEKLLSRRKRYLAFPEGASLTVRWTLFCLVVLTIIVNCILWIQLAFCETVGFVGTPVSHWLTYQLDWGVVYDLPNETWVIHQRHYTKPKSVILRRNRRDLYGKLETLIES